MGLEDDWVTFSEEDKEDSEAGQFEIELMREARENLDAARNRLPARVLSVSTQIAEGSPSDEILAELERGEYDLVVLGATASRDLKHLMAGSVSSKVVWNAPCSVLIVRESQ